MADWLILESTREELFAAEVRTSAGVMEVVRAARTPLLENFAADPDVLAEQIRKLLPGSSFRQALLVAARDVAVFRQFELPPVPPEELPELVKFQAATKFSTPADELRLDYIPFSPRAEGMGRSVLAASIDREMLVRWNQACTLAGLQLVGCTVSSVAMAELVARHAHRTQSDLPPTLVLYAEENKVEVLLLDEGIPLFSSTIHIRVEGQSVERLLEREWKRALVQLGQTHPGKSIDQAVYCGRPNAAIDTWLQQVLPGSWSRFDPLVSLRDQLRLGDWGGQVSLPQLGWGLAQESPQVQTLDFLRPRKPAPKKDYTVWKWSAAAAAAALILLGSYGGYQWRLAAINQEVKDLQQRHKSLVAANKEQQPVLESQLLLRTWTESRQDTAEFLVNLNALSPATDRLYFKSLNVDPAGGEKLMTLTGNGQARARSDVERLYEELETHGFRVRAKAINPGPRDPDYPITFELDADYLRPAPAAAAPTTDTPPTT